METRILKKLISKTPTRPGVYMFTGGRRKLYIGKASNLKVRLLSYLKTTDLRLFKMLSLATGIKTLETDSEIEALILESQYIKKYKPAFNIMLRDDKNFFYVAFSNDKFARVFITHQPHASRFTLQGLSFVGPFTDGTALKTTLRYLRRVFPYCTCKKPHNNFCLNYHIGKCFGFCCLKNISYDIKIRQEYRKNIKAIKEILGGKKTSLLKGLEKEMIKLGKKEKFEKAIELKNKIERIKRIFENARIIQNIPHSHISLYGNGHKSVLRDLKKVLGSIRMPIRIEGYDVSNIQGKYAVGAMVVFIDGKPDKSEYRKFKIYTKRSQDDTTMLKEVLERRFKHIEWPFPDLVVVDGGRTQLNIARPVVKNIPIVALTKDERHRGSKIFIAGPSRSGFAFGEKNSIPLPRLPTSVKNLLLQIDSEAHRFAIGYYRKLHQQKFLF